MRDKSGRDSQAKSEQSGRGLYHPGHPVKNEECPGKVGDLAHKITKKHHSRVQLDFEIRKLLNTSVDMHGQAGENHSKNKIPSTIYRSIVLLSRMISVC